MSEFFPGPGMFGRPMVQVARTVTQSATKSNVVHLVRTDQPVWPEDEQAENDLLRAEGERLPVLADRSVAEEVLKEATFSLPLTLPATDVAQAGAKWQYPGFRLKPSFISQENALLWRLRLILRLSVPGHSGGGHTDNSPDLPLAVYVTPTSNVTEKSSISGELGVDFGKLTSFFPPMPDIFTAKVGSQFKMTKFYTNISGGNPGRPNCEWYVAGPLMTEKFEAGVTARVPVGQPLVVEAELHVEIRKQGLGISHKIYAMSERGVSLLYIYNPGDKFFDRFVNPQSWWAGRSQPAPEKRNTAKDDDATGEVLNPQVLNPQVLNPQPPAESGESAFSSSVLDSFVPSPEFAELFIPAADIRSGIGSSPEVGSEAVKAEVPGSRLPPGNDGLRTDGQLQKRLDEATVAQAEAKARRAEAKARQAEAKARRAEAKARQAEAKACQAEAKAAQAESSA